MKQGVIKKWIRILLGLCILYSTAWWVVANKIKSITEVHLDTLKKTGYEMTYENLSISGFPFSLGITFIKPCASPSNSKRLLFKAEGKLVLSLSWWSYLTGDGAARLTSSNKTSLVYHLDPYGTVKIDTEKLEAKAGLKGEKLNRYVWLDLQDTHIQLPSGKTYAEKIIFQNIKISELDAPTRLKIIFDAYNVDSGVKLSSLPDQKIQSIHCHARLDCNKDLPKKTSALLHAFSQEGAAIEIEKAEVQWGDIHLNTNGTLTLDELKQPVAAFSASMKGLDKILDSLAEKRVIKKNIAHIAKSVLGIFKKPGLLPTDLPSYTISFSIQNGEFSIGSIPLFRFSPIHWPEG